MVKCEHFKVVRIKHESKDLWECVNCETQFKPINKLSITRQMELKTYKFEIQVTQEIEVEGIDKENARMRIIDLDETTILTSSADDLGLSPYISDGVEVKETSN